MNPSTVNSSIDDESSRGKDENITYPVISNFAIAPSTDGRSSETEAESLTCTISNNETEADDESAACPVSVSSAITTSDDDMSTETEAESGTCTFNDLETEANEKGVSHAVSKTLMAQILKGQTEETRLNLVCIAEDTDFDEPTRLFVSKVAVIIEWWQHYAGEENPTSHQIDFGTGLPINLLMVLALLPEKYQGFIRIGDKHRSPSADGENLSWIHEQTMDVLVGLSMDPVPSSLVFGQGLASMVRDDVDEGWRGFTGRSWLEDQIHLWSNNELEPNLYRFPPETEKIVFFFNPTEIHWMVVEVDLHDDVWTYTLYNSLYSGEKGPTWGACEKQFPLLEQLICRASGISEPTAREIVPATSAQQDNHYDCGPIAIFNLLARLEGRTPTAEVDADILRFGYLSLIFEALCLMGEKLEAPEFRARMRGMFLYYAR